MNASDPRDIAILNALLEIADLSDDAGRAFLEEKCPADVRAQVESAIQLAEQYPRFLQPEAADSFEPPRQVEEYEVQTLIGEGSYGAVYKAWDSKLQRPVAIKFLHAPYSSNCFHEAQMLAQCELRAIPAVHRTGIVDTIGPYLVMQLVDGPTILQAPDCLRLPLICGVKLLADVATTLNAAHQLGFIHKDLKSEHLRVLADPMDANGKEYAIYILDWGIAAAQSSPHHSSLGTYVYAAPEQRVGQTATARSDVYSLGLVFVELVTGLSADDFRDTLDSSLADRARCQSIRAIRECDRTLWNWFSTLALWIDYRLALDLGRKNLVRLEEPDELARREVLLRRAVSSTMREDAEVDLFHWDLGLCQQSRIEAVLFYALHPDPSQRSSAAAFADGLRSLVQCFEYRTDASFLAPKRSRAHY